MHNRLGRGEFWRPDTLIEFRKMQSKHTHKPNPAWFFGRAGRVGPARGDT